MSELDLQSTSAVQKFSQEAVRKILQFWPLARFSKSFMQSVAESKDEKFFQNLSVAFQLREIRPLYEILDSQIPKLFLIIPLRFISNENENSIVWVGDHDPFGLSDCITVIARTTWQAKTAIFKADVNWDRNNLDKESFEYLRCLVRLVPSKIFDEAILNFLRLLNVTTACPIEDEGDDGLPEHPTNCSLCQNHGRVFLAQTLSKEFRPSIWLEMMLSFSGWA